MAQVVDAKYSTLIGTPKQLRELLRLLRGSATVDLKFSNLVVLDKIDLGKLQAALETTPRKQ